MKMFSDGARNENSRLSSSLKIQRRPNVGAYSSADVEPMHTLEGPKR